MADANLVIRIRETGERHLKQIRRDLDRITASATAAGVALRAFARGYNDNWSKTLRNINKQWTRHFDEVDKIVKALGSTLLKGLGVALKATGAEFALMGLTMVGVHGSFALGSKLANAYHKSLQVVAAGAAAATVALATAAAAMREYNAAMFAYKAQGYKQFGSNLNQVRVVMRGLENDSVLASVGVENLNAAFQAVSKRSTFNRGSQNLLRGLMDFASAGQPLDQGAKAAGELIGVLQDPKASFSEVTKAAESLGPSMKKALEEAKKQGIDTADELKKAILDGSLATMGGVEGQFGAVNSTIVGVFKQGLNSIRAMFADMGQPFLEPVKQAIEQIKVIFQRTFLQVQGNLTKFGRKNFVDSLVGLAEKFEKIFVTLIRDYLPKADGMIQRMRDSWANFKDGWNDFKDGLRPLIEGSRVLLNLFKSIFGPVWDRIKEKFGDFNQQLQDNEPNLLKFGDALGNMLVSFSKVTDTVRDLVFQALPFITKLVDGIRQVADLLNGMLGSFGGMFGAAGGGFGAFGVLMGLGIVGRQMKNTKGGFIPKTTGNMTVNAQNVVVTGATAGGQMNPGSAIAQKHFGTPFGPGMPTGGRSGRVMSQGMQSARNTVNASRMVAQTGMPLTPAQGAQMGLSPAQVAQANQRGLARAKAAQAKFNSAMDVRNTPGFLQRFSGNNIRGRRASSVAYQRAMKFNTSGTAKMGAMAAMGMLGSFMPAETQGAMALGSTIGAFNPMLGLATAGLGTALTSQNAAVGMLGGVAGGGALGMQLAGPAGAIVGAVAGGLVGAVKAVWNKNQAAKKAAREAATGATEQIFDSMIKGIARTTERYGASAISASGAGGQTGLANTLKIQQMRSLSNRASAYTDKSNYTHEQRQALVADIYANQALLGFEMSMADYEKAFDKPKEFLETFGDQIAETAGAAGIIDATYTQRINVFKDALNMTEREIQNLAITTGTNLYDAARDGSEILKQLAKGLVDTFEDAQNAYAELQARTLTAFDTAIKREEAPFVIDEAAQNLLDMVAGGEYKQSEVLDYGRQLYSGLIDFYEGDAMKAGLEFNRMFGESGFAYSGPNAYFSGGTGAIIQEILAPIASQLAAGQADITSELLTSALTAESLAGISTTGQLGAEIAAILSNPQAGLDFNKILGEGFVDMTQAEIASLLQGLGINMVVEEIDTAALEISQDLTNASSTFTTALETMAGALNDALVSLGVNPDGPPDTRTPRGDTLSSRFDRTMTAHRKIDQMTTGKRHVTSGWRNFNLGSPSSDHVMGRAYDLVGQNLGQYKSLIDQSGGFAEFHGSAGSRHLHVVPNTSGAGAIGDTMTPLSGGVSGGGTVGNVSYNYTINVNGGVQSAEEIANTVMTRIKERERSDRERRNG